MAVKISTVLADLSTELRYEPVRQRVRVSYGDHVVAETSEAVLVWEPHATIPAYAVPATSITVATAETPYAAPAQVPPVIAYEKRGFLHAVDGRSVAMTVDGDEIVDAGFRFSDDPDLADHVLLRWSAFTWTEEATEVIVHPQDPYVRISTRHSDRHVVVDYRGQRLAESTRAVVLYETGLPPRWYLPREDLTPGLFVDSDTHSECPYKGVASYLALGTEARGKDLAWFYPDPFNDAEPVRDLVCIWAERTDLTLDGVPVPRPGAHG